ncbi:unnamed protein product, partial [Prorocentrum cordatum]
EKHCSARALSFHADAAATPARAVSCGADAAGGPEAAAVPSGLRDQTAASAWWSCPRGCRRPPPASSQHNPAVTMPRSCCRTRTRQASSACWAPSRRSTFARGCAPSWVSTASASRTIAGSRRAWPPSGVDGPAPPVPGELFDAQLEGFLAAEGVPREAFVALARSLSRARADYRTGWDAFLAEITASSDYGGFVALMRAAAEARRAEEFEASMSVEMAEVARDPAPDPRG